jgi:hypothetical protein
MEWQEKRKKAANDSSKKRQLKLARKAQGKKDDATPFALSAQTNFDIQNAMRRNRKEITPRPPPFP